MTTGRSERCTETSTAPDGGAVRCDGFAGHDVGPDATEHCADYGGPGGRAGEQVHRWATAGKRVASGLACDDCGASLLSGEHGVGLCVPGDRPRWFSGLGSRSGGAPWNLGRTPSDRAKDEALGAAVSALRACGDPWGLDAGRLEQAESPRTLVARVDAVTADVQDDGARGHGDPAKLRVALEAMERLRALLRPPGRFLFIFPDAVPWRRRAEQDPLAASLVHAGGTDEEAADLFAAALARSERDGRRLAELSAVPSFRIDAVLASPIVPLGPGIEAVLPQLGIPADDREVLGQLVRQVWIEWAKEQPSPKVSWLAPWEALQEPEREVDRRIGEAVAWHVLVGAHEDQARLARLAPDPPFRAPSGAGSLTLAMPDGTPVVVFRRAAIELRGEDRELYPALLRWARATVLDEGKAGRLPRSEDAGQAWREMAEGLEREQALRVSLRLVSTSLDDVWLWQGDGANYAESLSCPVVMSADRLRDLLGASGPDASLRCPWGCGHDTEQLWDFDWRAGVQITLCPGCQKPVDFLVAYRASRSENVTSIWSPDEPEGPRGPSPSAGELPGWKLTTQGYVRGPWRIYQAETWCVALRAGVERLVARAFESPKEAGAFVLMAAGSVLPARGADPAAHDPDGEMRRAGGS